MKHVHTKLSLKMIECYIYFWKNSLDVKSLDKVNVWPLDVWDLRHVSVKDSYSNELDNLMGLLGSCKDNARNPS